MPRRDPLTSRGKSSAFSLRSDVRALLYGVYLGAGAGRPKFGQADPNWLEIEAARSDTSLIGRGLSNRISRSLHRLIRHHRFTH